MIVTCPNCSSGLDITGIPPGNAVACGACGKPFWIAGGVTPPAVPPSPAAPPPPPAPPPQRRPAPPPAAARAPAPVAVHAREHSSGRGAKKRRSSGPAGKNPMPLMLAFGCVVALAAGGVVFALTRGKKPAVPIPAPGTATAPLGGAPAADPAALPSATPTPSPPTPRTPLEEKAFAAGQSVAEYLEGQMKMVAMSPEFARRIVENLRGFGRPEEARRALESGRQYHPHDPWLNGELGLRDRTKEIQAAAADETMMDLLAELPAFQEVVKQKERISRETGAGWLDEEGSRDLDRRLAECREQVAWLNDPVNAATNRIIVNLRYDPDFAGIGFTAVVERPFVILIEDEPEPARREAVRGSAERAAKAMAGAYRAFLEFLRRDVGLTDAPRLEDEGDVRLRAVMFRSRKSFDQWTSSHGDKVSSAVVAFYSPVRQMVVMHADMDWATPSGVKGLPHDQSVCMHEAVHQLFDWYQRWYCDKAGKRIPEGGWILNPTRSTPDVLFWFQEGLADYFGASAPVAGKAGLYEPGQPDRGHLAVLKDVRARNEVWKVEDFLLADQAEIHAMAAKRGWGRGGADALTGLMYSHGWALVHFLLHGEGGKWRAPFLKYIAAEIRGDHFRMRLDELMRDLPEFKKVLDANPDLEYALKDRRDLAIPLIGIMQKVPQFARMLRTRDLCGAFGMPASTTDEAIKKWMVGLQAGYGAHCDRLLGEMGK